MLSGNAEAPTVCHIISFAYQTSPINNSLRQVLLSLFYKRKTKTQRLSHLADKWQSTDFGPKFYMAFPFFAFGSKSKLKRHINVTPYSLEYLEISHWLAFQPGFLELVGSFQALNSERCHRGTVSSSRRGVGRSKQREGGLRCKCCVYNANQSPGFVWRGQKAPS